MASSTDHHPVGLIEYYTLLVVRRHRMKWTYWGTSPRPIILELFSQLSPSLILNIQSETYLTGIETFLQVYHKPPTSFVEGHGGLKRALPSRGPSDLPQAQVIPEPSSLIGDLLSLDIGGGGSAAAAIAAGLGGDIDLLSGGLDAIAGQQAAPVQQVLFLWKLTIIRSPNRPLSFPNISCFFSRHQYEFRPSVQFLTNEGSYKLTKCEFYEKAIS